MPGGVVHVLLGHLVVSCSSWHIASTAGGRETTPNPGTLMRGGGGDDDTAAVHSSRDKPERTETRRNVVLMVMDDARPDLNYAYGQTFMKTPHMDRLAKSGMVFRHAYCQFAVCSPSRNSMLTGRREACIVLVLLFSACLKLDPQLQLRIAGPDTTKVYNFLTK